MQFVCQGRRRSRGAFDSLDRQTRIGQNRLAIPGQVAVTTSNGYSSDSGYPQ